MTKTKGKRGRYKKPKLSIYRITPTIYELRITWKTMTYKETLYMTLNELRVFLELTTKSIDVEKAIRCLAKSKYFVHQYH